MTEGGRPSSSGRLRRSEASAPSAPPSPSIDRPRLRGIVAHATTVPAEDRDRFARRLRADPPPASVVIETCHRVEVYGVGDDRGSFAGELPAGARRLDERAAAEHLIALAVGLRSAILAEDQLLHQLRSSVEQARGRGPLPVEVDRLLDLALRAGRRGRSWLPARRPSLADAALDLFPGSLAGQRVIVVGTGPMGRLAIAAAARHGARVGVASRTPERAASVAADAHADVVAFDPGPTIAEAAAVIVALRGPWTIGPATERVLLTGDTWIVDLSAPPATSAQLRAALGVRFISIDDLATGPEPVADDRLVRRLRALAEATVAEYLAWAEREPVRATARAMAERAEAVRATELGELWRRLPDLPTAERDEIERMTRHLAERLLREPLERLGQDADGRHDRAARELFGL
ncbi:MAG: NAD(P)-binding domain-containing protein [Candidatus Limnocylindrales bacterium]